MIASATRGWHRSTSLRTTCVCRTGPCLYRHETHRSCWPHGLGIGCVIQSIITYDWGRAVRLVSHFISVWQVNTMQWCQNMANFSTICIIYATYFAREGAVSGVFNEFSAWLYRVLCQKQVSRAGTINYIPQVLWGGMTCPCPWYLYTSHMFYGCHSHTVCNIVL